MPPLLDYPNHLARAVVLAFGDSDPVLSRMYAAHWAIIPNLGMDLVLPPLLHVLPIHLAGRMVVGGAILLPVIGTIAYSRATFGTRSAWPLASGLVAYNATLLLGFLNFAAAIGIALLLAAAWISVARPLPAPHRCAGGHRHGRTVLLPPDGAGVLLCADRRTRTGMALQPPQRRATAILARVAALVPLIALPLGLYLMSPLAPLAGETEFPSPADKAAANVVSVHQLPSAARHRHRLRGGARSCSAASPQVAAASRPAPAWRCCWLAVSIWRPHGPSRARISSTPAS